jgi:hypothetical protein
LGDISALANLKEKMEGGEGTEEAK